ncbi:hypothetical protein OG562_22050 [Streptomyces sp. NBC_01275]|uniref:hypothetical protein n=1 Tax=Streptomyces sp. NBC_01275 TaxID=2903807 RepID=UPI0022526126|nr:hypothetical protein [Streptomyces sp. NBC_01275]MCX4763595.1 hypothetical protein [Streptomyces sp. NBC_01275]
MTGVTGVERGVLATAGTGEGSLVGVERGAAGEGAVLRAAALWMPGPVPVGLASPAEGAEGPDAVCTTGAPGVLEGAEPAGAGAWFGRPAEVSERGGGVLAAVGADVGVGRTGVGALGVWVN